MSGKAQQRFWLHPSPAAEHSSASFAWTSLNLCAIRLVFDRAAD
jgi:hypothetical protein